MNRKIRVVFYILAALCTLTGAFFLTVYTAMRFSGFLLCCAGAAMVLWAVLGKLAAAGKNWAKWCRRVFAALLAAGFTLFALMEMWVLEWSRTDEDTPVAAVVVFGAGVNGAVPSLSLRVRLEAALDYVRDKPDIPIVVSGSQGPGEDISEARCMADWLIARGVDAGRVLLEERANNTEENVRYSRELLTAYGVDPLSSVAYVTADYHLCRAVYHAAGSSRYTRVYRSEEYPYVVPVAAHMPDRFWPLTANYYIREAFAMARLVLLP